MSGNKNKKTWDPLLKFTVYIVAGFVVFCLIGGGAYVLDILIEHLESKNFNGVYLTTLTGIKYFMFGLDCILFCIFLVKKSIKLIKEI